jgi:hypothetical protein
VWAGFIQYPESSGEFLRNGNYNSGSIKDGAFLRQLSFNQLMKKDVIQRIRWLVSHVLPEK